MECMLALLLVLAAQAAQAVPDEPETLEDTVKTLRGQVSALLERRQEDYRLLEQSLRHTLEKSSELASLKEDLDKLREDVQTSTGRKNEQLTAQWVTASVAELRAELLELARAHNESTERAARSDLRAQVRLARADAAATRRELERLRADHVRAVADLTQARQDVAALQSAHQLSAKKCAETRQQVLGLQSEWQVAKRSLRQGSAGSAGSAQGAEQGPADNEEENMVPSTPSAHVQHLQHDGPLRHHHLVKAQIKQLAAETRSLRDSHLQLRKQMRRLEHQLHAEALRPRLERVVDDVAVTVDAAEVLPRLAALENATRSLSQSVWNATRQVSGLAALRGSTLQLLESIESLESKVDANVPAVQREISRLEFLLAQVRAVAHENKEDQENQSASLKAMAASLSTLQERTAGLPADRALLAVLEQRIANVTERQDVLERAARRMRRLRHSGHSDRKDDDDDDDDDEEEEDEDEVVDQVADDASVPRLVDELSHVQAEYQDIVHKLPRDCSGVRGDSGEYLVAADGAGAPVMVPCDQRTGRGGWTVIQRRADGSQDFNRKWEDYSKGFGALSGEFWLGNEALHRLTADGCMELRVELGDIYGQRWLAEYAQFVVGAREDGYRLSVSGYRGNASDALDYQAGMEFSAPDRDRDTSHTHCAQNYEGGWWFSHCQHANLNGRYNLGLTWFQADRNEWIAVATSELKVRRPAGCVSRPVVVSPSSSTTTTSSFSTTTSAALTTPTTTDASFTTSSADRTV